MPSILETIEGLDEFRDDSAVQALLRNERFLDSEFPAEEPPPADDKAVVEQTKNLPALTRSAVESMHVKRVMNAERQTRDSVKEFFRESVLEIAAGVEGQDVTLDPEDAEKQAAELVDASFDPDQNLRDLVRAIAPHLAAAFVVGAGAEVKLNLAAAKAKQARLKHLPGQHNQASHGSGGGEHIEAGDPNYPLASQGMLPLSRGARWNELRKLPQDAESAARFLDDYGLDFDSLIERPHLDELYRLATNDRFVQDTDVKSYFGMDAAGWSKAVKGDDYTFPGTRSMSDDKARAEGYATDGGVVVEVNLPKGTRSWTATVAGLHERGMLPGLRFKVVSTEAADGFTRVRADLIDDGTAFIKRLHDLRGQIDALNTQG